MEEENKVVEAEVAEAPKEEPKQEEGGMTPNCKTALIAFILSGNHARYNPECFCHIFLSNKHENQLRICHLRLHH